MYRSARSREPARSVARIVALVVAVGGLAGLSLGVGLLLVGDGLGGGDAVVVANRPDDRPPVTVVSPSSTATPAPDGTTVAPATPSAPPPAAPAAPAAELVAVPDTPAWTVILASLPTGETSRNGAEARARSYATEGVDDVGVLDSSSFGSLNSGYWVVFAGAWDAVDPARDYCTSLRDDGLARSCYPRQLAD